MCGIWFIQNANGVDYSHAYNTIQHRGPDKTTVKIHDDSVFAFHRLAINDVSVTGDQPFECNNVVLMCNGEIYNHSDLNHMYKCVGESDCEIIAQMIAAYVPMDVVCNALDGVFAFVGKRGNDVFAARDIIGVRPLYYGFTEEKSIVFSSELKGLIDVCEDVSIKEFPHGHYYVNGVFYRFASAKFYPSPGAQYSSATLRALLQAAVEKRLMSDVPVGFFLSGGLDSSIIAGIGARALGKIKTFSIGIGDSPDLEAAKEVARHIDSDHSEIRFTERDGLDALVNVIQQLETYDCTTIRASVPMYLLSKYVKENTHIKVILSGEGADELFGGYLYFHGAPTPQALHDECIRLLDNVHCHDVLRADRTTAAHGLELRVPFFDRTLMNYVKAIDPKYRAPHEGLEKHILRSAFTGTKIIPESIISRQKNGMSDAVGYSWVDFLRKHAEENVSDEDYSKCSEYYTRNIPASKEELMYRMIYESYYGTVDNVPHIWRPRWTSETDPSAAKLSVHNK